MWSCTRASIAAGASDNTHLLPICLSIFSTLEEFGKINDLALIHTYSTLVCSVIKNAQDCRSFRCKALAGQVARLSLTLIEQLLSDGSLAQDERVANLISVLHDINTYLSRLATKKWYWKFWKRRSIKYAIARYSKRLDEYCRIISTSEEPDVRWITKALQDRIDNGKQPPSYQCASGKNVNVMAVSGLTCKLVQPNILKVPIGGHFNDPTAGRSISGHVLIAKLPSTHKNPRYRPRGLDNVWRPSILQYLESRVLSSHLPLPLIDYTAHSVRDHLSDKLRGNDVDGFMTSLALLEGAAAGISYLHDRQVLDVATLHACTQVPSFTFGGSGQIVLGRGILSTEQPVGENGGGIPDAWLIDQFWRITMELLYGDLDAIAWNNWSSIQTIAPHARPLLCFCSYDCPSFATLGDRLTGLLESLNSSLRSGSLNYPTIRQQLMRLPYIDLDYFYWPDVAFDVTIGDVGYISDGSFVKVHNIRHEMPFDIVPSPGYFRSSGDFFSEELANGDIRHTFKGPLCVKILRRDRSECCEKPLLLWSYFIEHARSIHQKYCRGLDLALTDLILVTASYYNRRFTSYEVRVQLEQVGDPLPDAQFIEYREAEPGQPWGEWLYDKGSFEIITDLQRQPQRINFIQLEKGEC
ncbi:hypothetical protein FRB95_008592 [Tulasnella sp. JGI-2019a]|nr:hypothetical protein FRB95_008592 [Tulasnella sp. JGI-2019a]